MGDYNQETTESVHMILLNVAGMKIRYIGRVYGVSRYVVGRKIDRIYQGFGVENKAGMSRTLILPYLVRAGYLEYLYVLMLLINLGMHDEAVRFVKRIDVHDGRGRNGIHDASW